MVEQQYYFRAEGTDFPMCSCTMVRGRRCVERRHATCAGAAG